MPATYTTSLRLTQPAIGDPNWGPTVNNGITALVDTSIAGTASIVMTPANYTLSNNNGASDEARAMFLALSGSPGGSFNVICPAVSKLYFVTNSTGHAQTVKTATGTGISVPNNSSMTLRCDGVNVVEALNYFGSLTLGAALPVASGGTGSTSTTYCSLTANVTGILPVDNGGTGASSFATNNVLLGNGTSALQAVAPGTSGNVLTSNGTTWQSSPPATPGLVLLSSVIPSASANVDLLNVFTSNYDNYVIIIDNVAPSSYGSTPELSIRFANGGVVDSSSNYLYQSSVGSGVTTNSAQIPISGLPAGYTSGEINIQNANDAVNYKFGNSLFVGNLSGVNTMQSYQKLIAYKAVASISGFRLFWSTSTNFVATGTVKVYGYRN